MKHLPIFSTLLFATSSLFAQNSQPNIVLILADDMGFECVGANGGTSYQTPNIDKMARQGIRFENGHSQPLCTPSRVQLMTGKYNVRNYTEFGTLDRSQITFANLLKDAGYKTAIAGKWQLGQESDSPQHFGFEESCLWQQSVSPRKGGHDNRYPNPVLEFNGEPRYFTNGEYGPDIVSDFLCDFMEENKDKPFFVYYPMILPHSPFVPTPDSEEYDPKDPGSVSYQGNREYYSDMISYVDKLVGKIIAKIEELDLNENTLIIFTGDNGTQPPIVSMLRGKEYPGGKQSTRDNGTHVPLIMRWDNTIKAGSESYDLIDFSDFLPTFCDIANISYPPDFISDGVSFLPQLKGKKGTPREWIYCWYLRDPGKDPVYELARNETYKLYSSGDFFNVKKDFFEENPIPYADLSRKEKKVHRTLNKAIGKYSGIRE
jgi:arylsulfatase A